MAAPPSVSTAPTTNVRDVSTTLDICESNVRGACSRGDQCDYHHVTLPYLWQVMHPAHTAPRHWHSLNAQSEDIERAYCDMKDLHKFDTEITTSDGVGSSLMVEIDLKSLHARLTSETLPGAVVPVRRLSTPSYIKATDNPEAITSDIRYYTQWRWYWWSDSTWKEFNTENIETPSQHLLESKYLDEQEIYRFVIKPKSASRHGAPEMIFLLNFQHMQLSCLNDQNSWTVRRRPMFVGLNDVAQEKYCSSQVPIPSPFLATLPDNWHPIDTDQQCELIPLNPETMAYHLVASEFHASLSQDSRVIHDVFRLQNPLLWNQYSIKKKWLENKQHVTSPELLLFHGTTDEAVVQAICRDNFDWRVCGKNNTVYGRGSYFAKHAAYSDRYAKRGAFVKWMFLARVLVGRYSKGVSDYVRPPPVDKAFPLGELYDSCVDTTDSPSIFVVFDKDQCYPEYLISYR